MATSADLLPYQFALTARLRNVASNEGLSVEQLAKKPDNELLRIPNLGRKSIRFLRQSYPAPPTVARETMSPAQLELLTEYLQRIEAQLDRIEMNLRAVMEAVERVAGQSVPGERGLGH